MILDRYGHGPLQSLMPIPSTLPLDHYVKKKKEKKPICGWILILPMEWWDPPQPTSCDSHSYCAFLVLQTSSLVAPSLSPFGVFDCTLVHGQTRSVLLLLILSIFFFFFNLLLVLILQLCCCFWL